jgi:hypothetical protein
METFCGWIDCYASYAGNYMPPGWATARVQRRVTEGEGLGGFTRRLKRQR